MQELAFKATHFSIVGSRIVSLIEPSLAVVQRFCEVKTEILKP